MLTWMICFVIGLFTGRCCGLIEYNNDCGNISITEPVIEGKFVQLQFTPTDPGDDRGYVTWRHTRPSWIYSHTVQNTSDHYTTRNLSTYTLNLLCDKSKDTDTSYWALFETSSGDECQSKWIVLDIMDASTGCGVLYQRTKNSDENEFVLEYYAQDNILKDPQSIRQLNKKSDDCGKAIGCPINDTQYDEVFRTSNGVYIYTIHNFTSEMNGKYTLQCTNKTSQNVATNAVQLVKPGPPQQPTFLDTTDIEGCQGCIVGKVDKEIIIGCQVIGGSYPVTVTMSIPSVGMSGTCTLNGEHEICEWNERLKDSYHLKEVRCEASNEFTDTPLRATSTVYGIVRPSVPYLYAPRQYEGSVDIYCKSVGDRPTPELYLLINGTVTNTTDVAVTNGRRIQLTYLHRKWNGATISCCMRHPYYDQPKCSSKTMIYYFSPDSIAINKRTSTTLDKIQFTQTLQCSVNNANPACSVDWSYPDAINVTIEAEKRLEPVGQGGVTTLSTLLLNATKEFNGEELRCHAVCEKFNMTMTGSTYRILVPYSPIIAINASKETSLFVGESITLECQADSFPEANISWFNARNEKMTTFRCGESTVCVELAQTRQQDTGLYTCKAETALYETQTRTFQLNVKSLGTDKYGRQDKKMPLQWIIVGLCAALVITILIIVAVILTKRRARTSAKPETDKHSMNAVSGHAATGENSGADTYDTIQDATYANTDGAGVAERAVINKEHVEHAMTEDAEYSVVITKPPRRTEKLSGNDQKPEVLSEPVELVYADLDLDTNGTTPSKLRKAAAEPQTEYVSIAFNEVGKPYIDTENIYANQ